LSTLLKKDNLDFKEDEIKVISSYFIELKNNNLFSNDDKRKFITYLGEAFRERYGGEWGFTGLKSDSYAVNEPVIIKYKNERIRKSPSETIFKIFENNDENYFNWANKHMEDWQKKLMIFFLNYFPKRNNNNNNRCHKEKTG